jgi:hypothetical protein
VLGILDLIDSNKLAAQQAAPAMVHLLRHENPAISEKAASVLANLSADRIVAFVPVLALESHNQEARAAKAFTSAPIGQDAVILNCFARHLSDFLESDIVNQSRMLSTAKQAGWYASDLHTVVTLGALCSDCPELRRGALKVLRGSVNTELGAEQRAMLEAALAFSAVDFLTRDIEVEDRNAFLCICSMMKPSPVLGSIIMAAHDRIQEQAARTNQAIKQDHYATLTLCSAAATLLPAEHLDAPLKHLMGLLAGSGHNNFYGAIALTELVGIISGEQARRVLDAVVKFLDRELSLLPPNSRHRGIEALASALGGVEGSDAFLYEKCRQMLVKNRGQYVESILHRIVSALVYKSDDAGFVKTAESMVRYLRADFN